MFGSCKRVTYLGVIIALVAGCPTKTPDMSTATDASTVSPAVDAGPAAEIADTGSSAATTSVDSGQTESSTDPEPDVTEVEAEMGESTEVTLPAATAGLMSGTIAVTDPASPIVGTAVDVPEAATDEEITFDISYADVALSGLPDGAEVTSKMIEIRATGSAEWNEDAIFEEPVAVTLPYEEPAEGEDTVQFYALMSDGSLEPMGFSAIDRENNTVTFLTRTFSDSSDATTKNRKEVDGAGHFARYVAIGLGTRIAAWFTGGLDIDTGFRPSRDGWYIPNMGAYYRRSSGGNCLGMSSFAKYYFRRHGSGLYSKYRDAMDTNAWVDDSTAIELASRVHAAETSIWNNHVSGEVDVQKPSAHDVMWSFLGALYITNQPALMYIQQMLTVGGKEQASGAHAISTYRAQIGADGSVTLHVYDPNFRGKDDRRIEYSAGSGFQIYDSNTMAGAADGYRYNYFKHIGFAVAASDDVLDKLKTSADMDFSDGSVFPVVTITSCEGKNDMLPCEEGTNEYGEHEYVTADTMVVLRGTILGGEAQVAGSVVDNARIFVSDRKGDIAVNNQAGGGDGTFGAFLPLHQGPNETVILGVRKKTFYNWAAFKRDIIRSTASSTNMTVTLSWSQNDSDVDLYVQEPSVNEVPGDTIYFRNRNGSNNEPHPYLDVDNTWGYGPEHYYATSGMSTLSSVGDSNPHGLYGTYRVGVHYYRDHDDDDESDQPITWSVSWRALAFCPEPCANPETDGVWIEGSTQGSLFDDDPYACCNIEYSNGSSWSGTWDIEYPEPNPDDYVVPDPPAVMLP